mmetsp:Transcript_13116/g.24157  ORF Transcript_13116/g.24157 Transcript_13116/m.24157 type:complete len:210 (+) Transcript_13116:530-1159(+)
MLTQVPPDHALFTMPRPQLSHAERPSTALKRTSNCSSCSTSFHTSPSLWLITRVAPRLLQSSLWDEVVTISLAPHSFASCIATRPQPDEPPKMRIFLLAAVAELKPAFLQRACHTVQHTTPMGAAASQDTCDGSFVRWETGTAQNSAQPPLPCLALSFSISKHPTTRSPTWKPVSTPSGSLATTPAKSLKMTSGNCTSKIALAMPPTIL